MWAALCSVHCPAWPSRLAADSGLQGCSLLPRANTNTSSPCPAQLANAAKTFRTAYQAHVEKFGSKQQQLYDAGEGLGMTHMLLCACCKWRAWLCSRCACFNRALLLFILCSFPVRIPLSLNCCRSHCVRCQHVHGWRLHGLHVCELVVVCPFFSLQPLWRIRMPS